jgi:hypothetical protein
MFICYHYEFKSAPVLYAPVSWQMCDIWQYNNYRWFRSKNENLIEKTGLPLFSRYIPSSPSSFQSSSSPLKQTIYPSLRRLSIAVSPTHRSLLAVSDSRIPSSPPLCLIHRHFPLFSLKLIWLKQRWNWRLKIVWLRLKIVWL